MSDELKWGVQLKTFITINEKEYCVSTVDLGGNIIPYAGFETMVFDAYEGEILYSDMELDDFTDRYTTEPQAIIGHLNTIEKLLYTLREEEQ